MALYAPHNLYRGINAHLNSLLQAEDDAWVEFHSAYIIVLGMLLNPTLREKGYIVAPEKSLQIREYHPTTLERIARTRRQTRKPDITIYDRNPSTPRIPTNSPSAAPTLSLPSSVSIDLDEESYLRNLVIREFVENKLGKPVVFIELLSPTNKPYGGGYLQYREKRAGVLEAGIVLVELDFLHESPSVVAEIPSYVQGEMNSHPYNIILTNPRPTLHQGRMDVFGFSVDDPIPPIEVPLREGDSTLIDFNTAYQQTYNSFSSFSVRVDYSVLPENFDRYSLADQKRIMQRMKATAEE